MTDGIKIALTAASGVAIFVFGQIVQRWLIDPIQEQRKLIGEIVFAVVYDANLFNYNAAFRHTINARYKLEELSGRRAELLDETYGTLKERTEEATTRLRRLSSQIHQSMQVIPCYWLLEKLGIVYNREKLCAVSNDLI